MPINHTHGTGSIKVIMTSLHFALYRYMSEGCSIILVVIPLDMELVVYG